MCRDLIISQIFQYCSIIFFQKNGRKRGCEFKEEYTENKSYTLFKSAERGNWYLGFRKNGKPLKGIAVQDKSKEECFKFQKLSKLPSRGSSKRRKCKRKNGPAGVDFCHETFQNIINSGRKIRHSKSHRRRRKG